MEASFASFNGLMFREHFVSSSPQGGTLIHLNPPGLLGSATPRAVKIRVGLSRPDSCQVTQGTEFPVSAKTPVAWAEMRSDHIQRLFTVGFCLSYCFPAESANRSFILHAFGNKDLYRRGIQIRHFSHATQGTGGVPGSVEPEKMNG